MSRRLRESYDPSGRCDSGITRSSVRGSTAMPDTVFLGSRSGRDIIETVYDRGR